MRILIVNDDGINAEGIRRLAELTAELGEVWVAAPKNQCSAMSHRLTVFGKIDVKPVKFPVNTVKAAYSVDGTPADCVKIALTYLMPQKPDIVFSGINRGYNAGMDIVYSGTIGAAMEALAAGIPSIAFSVEMNQVYDVTDKYLLPLVKELMAKPIARNRIWNINFPGCTLDRFNGILYDRAAAQEQLYHDHYIKEDGADGAFVLRPMGYPIEQAKEGTDIKAVLDNYISVGTVLNTVMTDEE